MPSTRSTTKPLLTYGRRAGTRIPTKEKKIQVYREFDEAATPAVEKTRSASRKAFNTPFIITTTSKEPNLSVTLNSSPPQSRTSLRLAWNLKTRQELDEFDKEVDAETVPSSRFQPAKSIEKVSPFDTDEEYSAGKDTDYDESSGIVIDPFQDESNVITDTSDEYDSDGDNNGLKINAPFSSPSSSPPIPSRSLKPMVVIHKRIATTTTTTTSAPMRNGVLTDKTTRSQVVSIGDYDTVVNPEKEQENQIHQGRSGKESKSTVTIIGEKEKGKGSKSVGRIAKAMRKAKSVVTRPKTPAPTMDTRARRKMYLPVPKDGYGTEMPRHTESLLDQYGAETADKGDIADDKLSFEEMLKEGGPVSRSRKSSRISSKLRIRRSDVSHMLENTDDDELSLPPGKYAVHYEGKEERVIRISVEGNVFDDSKKGVTYPIDLPSEPPVATSTPRHKRQHSNIPDKATKKLKIPKLGKDSTEIRKSTRQQKISPSKVECADIHHSPKDDGIKAFKEKRKGTKIQSNGKKIGGVQKDTMEEASTSKKKIKSGKTTKKNLIDTRPNDSGLMDMVESSASE